MKKKDVQFTREPIDLESRVTTKNKKRLISPSSHKCGQLIPKLCQPMKINANNSQQAWAELSRSSETRLKALHSLGSHFIG